MKLMAIGDLHGRDVWKQAAIQEVDRVVFLGDYTDSRAGLTDGVIYRNLVEIIQLKQQQPDKVILLIGNHDAQYLHYPNYSCSGFRPAAQPALTALFAEHKDLFQLAYQQGTHLFTHAGVSSDWYRYRKPYPDNRNEDEQASLASRLNDLHQREDLMDILFDVGPIRGGYEPYGGPVWADRSETIDRYLRGYHQVVGHTPVADITTYGDVDGSITYCDVTQKKADFYRVDL